MHFLKANFLLKSCLGNGTNKGGKAENKLSTVCLRLRAQPVDATHALNLSAGVSNSNVLRGRSFSCRATALSFV